jgi:hypothetical protein
VMLIVMAEGSRSWMELPVMFWHTAVMAAWIGCCHRSVGYIAWLLLVGFCLRGPRNGVAEGQDEPKVVDGGVPTLHVSTNLIQIPIAENKFSVSLEDGPGRRVILAITDGHDGGSRWERVNLELRMGLPG